MAENLEGERQGKRNVWEGRNGARGETKKSERGRDLKLWGQIFLSFFRIGLFTFGGGYAMIPLIQRELVETRRWLETEDFLNALAVVQSAPGALAINTAAYTGYRIAGLGGALMAVFGSTVPSFLVIILVAHFFLRFQDHPLIARVFQGMRPAIVALMAEAALRLARPAVKSRLDLALAVGALLVLFLFHLSPVVVILAAAGIGLAGRDRGNSGGEEKQGGREL